MLFLAKLIQPFNVKGSSGTKSIIFQKILY